MSSLNRKMYGLGLFDSPVRSPRPEDCGPGTVWRKGFTATNKRSGKKYYVSSNCVKARDKGQNIRRSPLMLNEDDCLAAGHVWRKAHSRRTRSGRILKVDPQCVRSRQGYKSMKKPASRSPRILSQAACLEAGHIWRKAHSRKTRSGSILDVPAQCVKRRRQRQQSPARSPAKSPMGKAECLKSGMTWRKSHSRRTRSGNIIQVPAKCVKAPTRRPDIFRIGNIY